MRILRRVLIGFICICITAFSFGCTDNSDTTSDSVNKNTSSVTSSQDAAFFAEVSEISEISEIGTPVASDTGSVSSSVSSNPSSGTAVSSNPYAIKYPQAVKAADGYDRTNIPFSFGNVVDSLNRPLNAYNQQIQYGHLGMVTLTGEENIIYLTFDEGYENGYTPKILDTLKEKNVKAVFFVTLSYVKKQPDLVRRMINEGHVVGNHSVTHPVMTTLSPEEVVEEIMGLHEYMLEHFGYEMHLFRPPTGAYSEATLAQAKALGYRTVEWSFAYADWNTDNQPDPTESKQTILKKAHDGAVYLLHAVSKTNTEILGDVIDGFRSQGYTLSLYPNTPPEN